MAVQVKLKRLDASGDARETIRKMISRHGGRDDSRDAAGKPVVGVFKDVAAARKFRVEAADYAKRATGA